jgi:indolepyruvate decarboxylase
LLKERSFLSSHPKSHLLPRHDYKPQAGKQITVKRLFERINNLLDDQKILVCDTGDCICAATDLYIEEADNFISQAYYLSIGYSLPATLGVSLARPDKRVINLIGDGAFQMTGWELGNCRRYGWDPIVLLFNNASWEMLRTFQPESSFNDLGHWGFAEMAAGMGGDGVRVGTRAELKAALDHAMATRGRFQLIEVTIPRGVLSSTLQRFVAGVKRLSAVK